MPEFRHARRSGEALSPLCRRRCGPFGNPDGVSRNLQRNEFEFPRRVLRFKSPTNRASVHRRLRVRFKNTSITCFNHHARCHRRPSDPSRNRDIPATWTEPLGDLKRYARYIPMTTATAKAFKSGNSQALRFPQAFRLSSKPEKLIKTADGFAVKDEFASARCAKAFAARAGSCPKFPEVPANPTANIPRNWE